MMNFKFLFAALTAGLSMAQSNGTYENPIINGGADPWAFKHDSSYYMMYTTNENITLYRSSKLTDWSAAESKLLYKPSSGMNDSTDLWAPEIHNINDRWYVIFTGDPAGDSPPPYIDALCPYNCPAVHHRMFVLESDGPDLWNSSYVFKAQLNTFDQFAIDGTYFQFKDGLYHIYSCWKDEYAAWPANLCITKMENPWTVSSTLQERLIISEPTNPWEKTPYNRSVNDRLSSNEGPQQLVNEKTGQNFVIYSAARSDNADYCLGQLELIGDDPMQLSSWRKHNEGCVFYQDPENQAYGVGHASFTKSPDDSEDWIVYHGMRDPTTGWAARTIRTQKFEWNCDGSPNFPRPGYGPYPVPAGQT